MKKFKIILTLFVGYLSIFAQPKIIEYEYWVNDNFATKVIKSINPSVYVNLEAELDLLQVKDGFNALHIRFKDSEGRWSSTISRIFFKAGKGNSPINKVVAYKYWFDNKVNESRTIYLQEPSNPATISTLLDLPTDTVETFNIQFLDTAGLWSTVYTKKFIPEADFIINSTINTVSFTNLSKFSNNFNWDFGDGNKSNLFHPTHTYNQPGAYDVCLIATNKLGTDTICKTIFVFGLREVTPSKAGNTGDATLFVYGAGFDSKTRVYLINKLGTRIEATRIQHYKLDALKCVFDLRGKQTGLYDVVAEFSDKEYRLSNSFIIEEGQKAEPFVKIDGRDRILFGRWQTYNLTFGNKGNVDAVGVPLVLIVSENSGLEVEFPEVLLNQNPILQEDTNYQNTWKNLPDYFKLNNLFDEAFNGRVYYFYIPSIPANYTGSAKVKIKTNENIQLYAWVTEPYFASPLDPRVEWCIRLAILKAIKDGIIDFGLNEAPLLGCINQIWTNYFEPYLWDAALPKPNSSDDRPKSWKETFFFLGKQHSGSCHGISKLRERFRCTIKSLLSCSTTNYNY